MKKRETVKTVWEVWSYDMWGGLKGEYNVNNRFCIGRAINIECAVETYNAGTQIEFKAVSPSDAQIKKALGLAAATRIVVAGDDLELYVTREKDARPLGEMRCISHKSLSPIQQKEVL